MHKSVSEYRDGFKAHVAVEPETGIITASASTPANTADGPTGIRLLDGEQRGCKSWPTRPTSGEVRVELRHRRHRAAIKALPMRHASPGGFDRDDFIIDHHNRTTTCPAGHCVPIAPRQSSTTTVLRARAGHLVTTYVVNVTRRSSPGARYHASPPRSIETSWPTARWMSPASSRTSCTSSLSR